MEFVSPEGLRLDGRRPMEMRQLRAEIGTVSRADGCAIFEMGNTKVIAAVYGPREFQHLKFQGFYEVIISRELMADNANTKKVGPTGCWKTHQRIYSAKGTKVQKWKLIIRNLLFKANTDEIKEMFSAAGFVWDVFIPKKS